MRIKDKKKFFLILILLLGAGLRFWGIEWGLPYEYQTEEHRNIKYPLRMGGTGDLNPHFFLYPSLYLYFMLFVYGCYYLLGRLFGIFSNTQDFAHSFIRDPTCFFLIGRGLEALFSLGIVFLTYRIGKKIFSEKAGLIAAFILTCLPNSIYTSHITKGDMAAMLLALLAWFFSYQIYKTAETKYYFLAGAFLGLAISTKYQMAMIGIALPVAHFLSLGSRKLRNLFISILLIPLFFFLGTPYALLSKEFLNQFIVVIGAGGGGYEPFWERFDLKTYVEKIVLLFLRYLRMFDYNYGFMIGAMGMGAMSCVGAVWMFLKEKRTFWIFLSPFLSFFGITLLIQPIPMSGYLQPVFPLSAILTTYFLEQCLSQKKWIKVTTLSIFFISLISSLGESFFVSYSFSLKDTRTIAKEWIEKNIPPEKKILMDILPYSPPLEMSIQQLTKFYQKAVETNHYKKEYFKLKLEVAQPEQMRYEIFVVQRTAKGLGVAPTLLEEVQKTQDLIQLSGTDFDFKNLKQKGIDVVIINSLAEAHAHIHHPEISAFYERLPEKARLIKVFSPESRLHPGPEIKIFQLVK